MHWFGDVNISAKRLNEMFSIHKAKAEHWCKICDKRIETGQYYIGYQWWKCCIGCYKTHIKNTENFVKGLNDSIKNLESQVNESKDKILMGEL